MNPIRRFLFDAGSTGGDAGGGAGATTGTPPVSGGNQGAGTDDKKFTQADLDRTISERYARMKEDAQKEILKALGVEKVEDAAAAVKAKQQAEEAAKSEIQKAAEAKAKAEAEAAAFKQQLEAEQKARVVDRRNGKIEAAAIAAGALDPADVLAWAERSAADLIVKTVKADNSIDDAAIKSLIEKAQKEKAHFFGKPQRGSTPGSPSNAGGKAPPKPNNQERGNKPTFRL